MANFIAYRKNYTDILDRVYQRAVCATVLNSPARMARAGRNVKEIMIPKISVTGLGDYTRNVDYKTGSIDFSYEIKVFGYDRGTKLLADVMDVEEAGIMDSFVEGGEERAAYGKAFVKELSKRLTEDYGCGFTETNLRYMRRFCFAFPNHHALRDELTWTHHRALSRVGDSKARARYEREAAERGWSIRTLERNISMQHCY